MIATKQKKPRKGKTRIEYRIADGAHITKDQAEPLFEVIKTKFNGERPIPEELVKEAKRKNSPIHHLFDWNVGRAAEAHWREQAQDYLRGIHMVEIDVETEVIIRGPVPFAVPTYDVRNTHKVIAYTPTQRISAREPISVVLERARREFRSWVSRYSNYVEFFDWFDPIIKEFERLERRLNKEGPQPKQK
ncbi:hypothetical protein LCGC14_2581870 [marine sediment metagenome]|uniref:Uncharacterized protein n=1 Tax=marine sediment metagenome TaxID=412755 RepID=A0A0F9B248_9ZZZZ